MLPLRQAVGVHRRLLDNDALSRSAVVANCAMIRERQLTGPNSYTRELRFNPLDRLTASVHTLGTTDAGAGWLDLCCGTGQALVQAADQIRRAGRAEQVALVGVDLVDTFPPTPAPDPPLRLICADSPPGHRPAPWV